MRQAGAPRQVRRSRWRLPRQLLHQASAGEPGATRPSALIERQPAPDRHLVWIDAGAYASVRAMAKYDPSTIEPKWQKTWESQGVFRTGRHPDRPKYYVLEMLPYPSG